jgi:hypothetical protein
MTFFPQSVARLFAVLAVALFSALDFSQAHAHGDDDHGASKAAPAGISSPRFAAQSDLFELVGSVDGRVMTLYLDRFADNAPITDAGIDIEIGKTKIQATPSADGSYRASSDLLAQHGTLALVITVTSGEDVDLLAADLQLPSAHTDAGSAMTLSGLRQWTLLQWAAGLFAILVVIAFLRRRSGKNARRNGAA